MVCIKGPPAQTSFLWRACVDYGLPVLHRASSHLVCSWGWGCFVGEQEHLSSSCRILFLGDHPKEEEAVEDMKQEETQDHREAEGEERGEEPVLK